MYQNTEAKTPPNKNVIKVYTATALGSVAMLSPYDSKYYDSESSPDSGRIMSIINLCRHKNKCIKMIRHRTTRRNKNIESAQNIVSTQNSVSSRTRSQTRNESQTHFEPRNQTQTRQNQPQEAELPKLVFSNQPKKNNGKKKKGSNSRASKNKKKALNFFLSLFFFWFGSDKRILYIAP